VQSLLIDYVRKRDAIASVFTATSQKQNT